MTIKRINAGSRMSDVVIAGGIAYFSGIVPTDTSGDVAEQTTSVLDRIDVLLAEAGLVRSNILRAEIYLANIVDFPRMNEVWDSWVTAGETPSRVTSEAKLARPEIKVEIMITALAN
ncbi:RidA family protein [Paracoccus saliphilus]|uniref:Enamine deaminase RidA, house cleaning of reactive enamine intermediates, YjgF/YER057c/UK114 family n=1 Tax=Paracoccus saliphilus TaxID=405559 RepID=A0AA45W2P6_9RHOB|nr:RidA family protein [Paracoccus saliphilus]WCR01462.1 RidA family protein [Paracoccus saliphilus]SIS69164.1 Enamine deaminase RidA, house cleaning of reactive enamine intermediates, YjgF/YER057c/UK114 family [Paracoccus saliphilus]